MLSDPFQTEDGKVEWDCLTGPAQEYIIRLERVARFAEQIIFWSRQDAMKTGIQKDNLYQIVREIAKELDL